MASAARQSRFTNYTMSNGTERASQPLGAGMPYPGADWNSSQNIWSNSISSFPKPPVPNPRGPLGTDENGHSVPVSLTSASEVDAWSRRGRWDPADAQMRTSGTASPTRTRDSYGDLGGSNSFTTSRPAVSQGPGYSLNRTMTTSAFDSSTNSFRYTPTTSDLATGADGSAVYPRPVSYASESSGLGIRSDSRNGHSQGAQAGAVDALHGYENGYENGYGGHTANMVNSGRPQVHPPGSFPAPTGPTRAYTTTQLDQPDLHETLQRSLTIQDASDVTPSSNFPTNSSRGFQFNPGSQSWDSNGLGPYKPAPHGYHLSDQDGIMADYANSKRVGSGGRSSPAINIRPNLASPKHLSDASIAPTAWSSRPASRDPRNGLEADRRSSTHSFASAANSQAMNLPSQQPAFYPPHFYNPALPPAYAAHLFDPYGTGFRPQLSFPQLGMPYSPYTHAGLAMHLPQGTKAQDPATLGRSRLLDEFRATSKSAKRYELKDIYNHVVEFSGDQHGSRFIQSKLETASSDEKDQVFQELEPNAVQLMKDVFGNYVIQKFFEHGNQVQKKALASQMKGKMLSLSTEMYACRVVQKALEHVLVEQQAELVKELETEIIRIIKDANGNHVVQKIIELVPRQYITFVMDSIRGQIIQLAQHNYGCRVIQRMMEHGSEEDKATIMAELHLHAPMLTTDPYGNYVIQHIITHGKPEDQKKIISVVLGQIVSLSKHKLASNVVEKCIISGTAQDRSAIRKIITAPGPDGTSPLQLMMKDQYANYVVQKLLEKLSGAERQAFVEEMKPQFNSLKKVSNGRQIAAIDRLISAVGNGGMGNTATPGLAVDISSAAPTPNLTMEPNTPLSSSPPSTGSMANDETVEDASENASKLPQPASGDCTSVQIDEP